MKRTEGAGVLPGLEDAGVRRARRETEADLQRRYDQLRDRALRMSRWLDSPGAQAFDPVEWDARHRRYSGVLEAMRRLGDRLRPTSLRSRGEQLSGDDLRDELLELMVA